MLSFISILSWTVFYKEEVLSFKGRRRYLQQIKKSQGFLTPFPRKSVVPEMKPVGILGYSGTSTISPSCYYLTIFCLPRISSKFFKKRKYVCLFQGQLGKIGGPYSAVVRLEGEKPKGAVDGGDYRKQVSGKIFGLL